MSSPHTAATATYVTNVSRETGQTRLHIAAGIGISAPLANEAAEQAVKAGTLERIEGGPLGKGI